MRKPLIGITCGPHYDNGVLFYGLLPPYTKSVAQAGGLPVMITPNLDEAVLRETFERMDGILIAGGGDIEPECYGQQNTGLSTEIDRGRDFTELTMTRWAASENKPLLGICRGCQVVNVALGGTLYQDIATDFPGANGISHDNWGKKPRNHRAHTVDIEPTTRLAEIIGETYPEVNSMHHQALHDVAPTLVVSAHSDDGMIEGVELPKAKFFIGVQWHPEELTEYSDSMRRLFQAFVDAAHD